ncbi:uncharacterized protein isoform X2 [Danio rerio]|uniref:Uncharacterized protein isoform X2 n=1 Tax=Danio rerio TaxID=7955 RepID=A0AC58J3X1_DANRE
MVSTVSSFESQLLSIMEAVVRTAVLEIRKLVDVERELLRAEVSRGRGEISALRRRLMELQPRTNTTHAHSFTAVKSECAQEDVRNHLNIRRGEVFLGESPLIIQQDQLPKEIPQQNCEINQPIIVVKDEPHEVDVWTGQGNSEEGTHSVEVVCLSPIKEVLKTVPCIDRGSKENTSKAESPALNRNSPPAIMPLNQMVQSISKKADKRFVCSYCSKRFRCFSQLTIHQRSHTGEKPYRCTICGKRYIQKGHLYTHQRTHTGEKPYRCPLCGKGFIQKCTLDMHLRSHTGEKPYTCVKCGKGFTTKFNLNKHLSCQSCGNFS